MITAAGGLEGIALARDHRPDVIFMDVKMADLDGFSATRRLAADESTKKIPVIAVTASAFGNTKEAALEAGCVEHLPKPVRAESLFAALKTHLGVQFVMEAEGEPAVTDVVEYLPRHAVLAPHLREAAEIGAISDLHVIAATLAFGDPLDAALSRRISAMAASFDFDSLRALAASLENMQGSTDAR